MGDAFPIVISHPHHRSIVRRVAAACEAEQIPYRLLTGSSFPPRQGLSALAGALPSGWSAKVKANMAKRHLAELDPGNVVSVCGVLPDLIARIHGGYRLGNFVHDWLASRWIGRQVPENTHGIFHGFSSLALQSLRAARKKGLITLLEIMSLPDTENIYAREYEALQRPHKMESMPGVMKELFEADYLIAQSPVVPRYLQAIGIAPDRIIVRPLGVDTQLFHPAPARETPRPFRAIFAGRLTVGKGLHRLLQAWIELDLKDAELCLAGPRVEPESSAILAPYAGSYRYLGELSPSDLAAAYRNSDIFVFPSLAEGGPLVMYEAMASGLPCIVTDIAQAVARDGIEALTYSSGDMAALKHHIALLYRDEALRRTMALAARSRAEEYSWDKYHRRSGEMYRDLLNRGRVLNALRV